jgi:hypothetical protein
MLGLFKFHSVNFPEWIHMNTHAHTRHTLDTHKNLITPEKGKLEVKKMRRNAKNKVVREGYATRRAETLSSQPAQELSKAAAASAAAAAAAVASDPAPARSRVRSKPAPQVHTSYCDDDQMLQCHMILWFLSFIFGAEETGRE